MIRTKHKPKFAGTFHASVDASLIEVGTEQVHAIRAAHIKRPVSIHIPDTRAVSGLDDRSDLEMMLNILLVLKRNPVGIHEGKVGNAHLELFTQRDRFRGALAKKSRQPVESRPAFLFNITGGRVAREKRALEMRVCGNPARYPSGQPWVTLNRFVFRARQQHPRVDLAKKIQGHRTAPSKRAVSISRSSRLSWSGS